MGNSWRQCCKREQEEPIEIPMVEVPKPQEAKEITLVLPKVIVIDEDNQEHEIYNPETSPPEEEQPEAEELGVQPTEQLEVRPVQPLNVQPIDRLHIPPTEEIGVRPRRRPPPVRRQQSRRRLMLVKPPPEEEEEAGPSGSSSRRTSLYSGRRLSGIASSSIAREDPFGILIQEMKDKRIRRLDMECEMSDSLRDYIAQFQHNAPSTPREVLFSPETPMERYQFYKFKKSCSEAKKRRKSWW